MFINIPYWWITCTVKRPSVEIEGLLIFTSRYPIFGVIRDTLHLNNSLKIPRWWSEAINQSTDNTIAKRSTIKGQAGVYKRLHKQLKIEQHVQTPCRCSEIAVLAPIVAPFELLLNDTYVLKRIGHCFYRLSKLTIFYFPIMSNLSYCPLTWHFCSEE